MIENLYALACIEFTAIKVKLRILFPLLEPLLTWQLTTTGIMQ
jgi:hypothetical protein